MKLSADSGDAVLTVVIPTLNSAATLDWTLASLQTKEIRVIVADSFSSDGTLAICRRWDVETISVPAGNMYRAINQGLKRASTEWLAYVNSDDWVFCSSYVQMLKAAIAGSHDVVYGSADYVDASGRFLFSMRPASGKVAAMMLRAGHLPFCQPASIFRRKTFEDLQGFDESYRASADFDFFFRAVLSKHSLCRVDLPPVAAFRLHEGQLSTKTPDLGHGEKLQMQHRLKANEKPMDKFALSVWQFSNLPWYAERVLRTYLLTGKLTIRRSHLPQTYGPAPTTENPIA